jgi:trimeric autotransporter adhesin
VGTGSDLLGLGGNDIFLRSETGQLVIWEVDDSGDLLNAGVRTTFDGAAVGIDEATTVVGTGSDLLGLGGNDIFLRSITGQLVIWEVNSSGALLNAGARTTAAGGIAAIDSETTIAGTATDLLGDGGNDILLRLGTGQLAVWEVNSSGGLLANTYRMPMLGSDASTQVLVGTTGNDILTGPSGASTLIGNGGNDTYYFGAGVTQEVIFNGTTGNVAAQGALVITAANSDTALWLDRVDDNGNVSATGNNLRIDELGTTNSAIIDNWFAAGDLNAELVELVLPGASGGALVLNAGVAALVNAMATFEASYQTSHGTAFDPTNPANATITDPTVLAAVNANWHH